MLCYFSVSSSQIIYFPSSGKYSLARSFSRVLTSVLFQSFWRVYLVAWVITLFSTSLLFHLTSYFCLISILLESSIWLLCDHSIPSGAIASSSNCHYLWFTLAPLGFHHRKCAIASSSNCHYLWFTLPPLGIHHRKCVLHFLVNDITSEICVFTLGFTLIFYMYACSVITV